MSDAMSFVRPVFRRCPPSAVLAVLVLLTSACASSPSHGPAVPSSDTGAEAGSMSQDAALRAGQAAYVSPAGDAAAGTPADAAPVRNGADPWEPFNRRVHGFNMVVDRNIAQPLARSYRAVTPPLVRRGVGNFFSNLQQPVTAVHLLLQGRPADAGSAVLRFTLNATLGLAGLLDPATDAGLRQYNEDLGQTLGVWGWSESRYLVLPFMGPSTLRDGFGRVGDAPLNPLRQIDPERDRYLIQGIGLVDLRATLMDLGEYEGSGDTYTLFRDAYLQRRRHMIGADGDSLPDYFDDYFDDDYIDGDASP